MDKYNVTGMSCAACVSHVEKAVRGVEGVTDVSVNLLLGSMSVDGEADPATVCKAVDNAGYHAILKSGGSAASAGSAVTAAGAASETAGAAAAGDAAASGASTSLSFLADLLCP